MERDVERDGPTPGDGSGSGGSGVGLQFLDSMGVGRWITAATRLLEVHRDEIDDLNVYPVPDGDTGTNMLYTVRGAEEALATRVDRPALRPGDVRAELHDVVRAAARGALLGARGNSGVILSQVFRGVAEAVDEHGALDAPGVVDALRRAADRAYEAVAKPVEGTILTVARAAADGAHRAHATAEPGGEAGAPDVPRPPGEPARLQEVVRSAVSAATEALALTPTMLPALARAGVVDAGGRGLEVVLLALLSVVEGREVAVERLERTARAVDVLTTARESGSDEFAYEVMYLLHATDEAVEVLKGDLLKLGDSLVVTGTGDGLWSVHVHVNDIGAAIEAGIEAGRVTRITVTHFEDQYAARAAAVPQGEGTARPRQGRAVVAVALGEGIEGTFRAEGAVVVSGGATFNPSTAELLEAVHRTGVDHVVLLPNEGNVVGVARAAARLARDEGIEAVVVPTRATVQGLAALVARMPDRPFESEVAAMSEAAEACAWGEVTVAVRAAETDIGPVVAGDVLGLHEGHVVHLGADVAEVARRLLDRMMGEEGELVTLVTGADADADLARTLSEHVTERWPEAEVQLVEGGQPHYPLVIGVE